jgi:hypothetical protein
VKEQIRTRPESDVESGKWRGAMVIGRAPVLTLAFQYFFRDDPQTKRRKERRFLSEPQRETVSEGEPREIRMNENPNPNKLIVCG